ncbi:AMP-binding protein [Oryzicola mucosus]|uniref:AMP-binding protein n=1 Tax=Oryzicola mucosus TaxID=2767425 RepID=A0A8J6Q5A1_9HYPH|nr:AMP-binding protein [Oryzicola mucosus]MBD0417335.1 AMP-binding protein [Oryzicola mucosus]
MNKLGGAAHEDRTGVLIGERFVSSTDLGERAARVAAGLHSMGVGTGDVIAIYVRNTPAVVEMSMGAARVGATVVPLNTAWLGSEVRYVLEDSRAKVLFAQTDLLSGIVNDLPDRLKIVVQKPLAEVVNAFQIPDKALVVPENYDVYEDWLSRFTPLQSVKPSIQAPTIFYTSGTTGKPKGVLRQLPTREQSVDRLKNLQTVYGIEDGARSLITTPLYHVFASAYAQTTLAKHGLVVLLPRFDAETLLSIVEEHRITNLQLVPTMFVRLLRLPQEVRERYDVSSLRHVLHTGAPCAPDVKRAMIAWWGPVIWEMFGTSETGVCVLCNSEEWLSHPGTVGRPFLGSRVGIYGPNGDVMKPGAIGDVYMRMPSMPDFTYIGRQADRDAAERDGLITAGDVGYLDEDGYLYLSDRRADIVISGGTNIYPAEIEHVIADKAGVADVAVVGLPDPEYGERLAAFVKCETGVVLSKEDVRAHVRGRLAGYKVPKDVFFVKNLPRDDAGKIIRRKVRDFSGPSQEIIS